MFRAVKNSLTSVWEAHKALQDINETAGTERFKKLKQHSLDYVGNRPTEDTYSGSSNTNNQTEGKGNWLTRFLFCTPAELENLHEVHVSEINRQIAEGKAPAELQGKTDKSSINNLAAEKSIHQARWGNEGTAGKLSLLAFMLQSLSGVLFSGWNFMTDPSSRGDSMAYMLSGLAQFGINWLPALQKNMPLNLILNFGVSSMLTPILLKMFGGMNSNNPQDLMRGGGIRAYA